MKIRTSLLVSFGTVIFFLTLLGVFSFATQLHFKDQYKATLNIITSEHEIIDDVNQLSDTYTKLLQNINDKSLLDEYGKTVSKVEGTFAALNSHAESGTDANIYGRIKNEFGLQGQLFELGISNTQKGDFSQSSDILDQINRGNAGIQEDVANLIIAELQSAEDQQQQIALLEKITEIIDAVLFLAVFGGSIIVAIRFSSRLSKPLVRLTGLAEAISGGDSHKTVDLDLVAMKNEVGSLSQSFNRMIVNVEDKINTRTKELAEERSRLLSSINSLSFGFLIVNLQHEIILKNRAILELFGLKGSDKVSVADISKMLGGFDIAVEAARCLESGKSVCEIKEIVFQKKILRGLVAPINVEGDKDIASASGSGSPQRIGYVFLLEDVTEAKAMERSRDEFFAVASHELRTPLTAIRGNAEMILDSFAAEIKNQDMREMLTDIDASSIRLIDIVNDFLEVSRLEQGRVEIKAEKFNLREVIDRVVKNLKSTTDKKDISLEFMHPDFPPLYVLADRNRVEQVLINLIGNSIKFTQKGGISVNLTKQDEHFLRVEVTDTGLGISEQNQSLLFRKFQQAGESMISRDVTQGTGLGLYICQKIISYMGGSIGLEKSELGKGSTFAFTLPVAS